MNKRMLNFEEAAKYTGYSKRFLYKLTAAGIIPFSKPKGNMLFLGREELKAFLMRNHSAGLTENQTKMTNYISSTL